ncbi:MAG: hypothetical protein M1831_006608 [Alyxoria varia]|nr:MAG: hypothetical protein M1831_006608 [Alyxoria varia]
MPYPPSLILATGATLILLLYKYILHPAFLSPLSRIPNAHSTSAVSPLWILWTRKRCRENAEVYAAHGRSGPVVRLGPAEVSVNCVEDGIRTVYAGGFEKHVWYPNVFTCYDGYA